MGRECYVVFLKPRAGLGRGYQVHVTQRSCWDPKSYSKGRTEAAHASPPVVDGMASRWMVDASCTNPCLLWPSLLLAVLNEGPHGNPHPTDSGKEDGLDEVRHAVTPGSCYTGSRLAMLRAPTREVCQVDWALLPLSTRRYLLQFSWRCWVQFLAELFGPRSWSRTVAYRYTVLPFGLHWYSSWGPGRVWDEVILPWVLCSSVGANQWAQWAKRTRATTRWALAPYSPYHTDCISTELQCTQGNMPPTSQGTPDVDSSAVLATET